jgi:hypothetical protein
LSTTSELDELLWMNSTRLDLAEFEFGFINEEGKGSCSRTNSGRSISKYIIG